MPLGRRVMEMGSCRRRAGAHFLLGSTFPVLRPPPLPQQHLTIAAMAGVKAGEQFEGVGRRSDLDRSYWLTAIRPRLGSPFLGRNFAIVDTLLVLPLLA